MIKHLADFSKRFTMIIRSCRLSLGGWMVPTRHTFAALMLEQGHVEEATQAYAEDLGLDKSLTRAHQHPNNALALHGYQECLLRLGRHSKALMINQQLQEALAVTGITVTSSCPLLCCHFTLLLNVRPGDLHFLLAKHVSCSP